MAVFFDHPIQRTGLGSADLVHHEVEWHEKFALLAVASKNESTDADGSVDFYLDEGEALEDASIHRSTVVECLQWHPEKKIIAVGWRSGEVTTYNDHDHDFFEQSSIHRSPLSFLRWNQSGTQLISGDKNGLLVVWKVDTRGQLHPSPLHQHRLPSPLTHCTMLHPPVSPNILGQSLPGDGSVLDSFSWKRKSAAMDAQASLDSIASFCATADSVVHFIGHVGECVERFQVEAPIHSLLLHREEKVMAVVTQDMVLYQYSVSSNGQTTQTMQAKLGGKNKAVSIIWVADGVLASCSNENIIRFWDFEHGDNYVLSIQQHVPITDEVITSISYNSDKGLLAGGTSAGNVVMWRWKGSPSSSSASPSSEGNERWEYLTTSVVAGPPKQIKWGSKKSLLAVNSGGTVQILTEHIMNTHFNQQVSAVQVSPGEVVVECHSTGVVHSIKSDIHVKGIYVTKEHVALWSGKRFVVYAISQEKTIVRVAGSFATEAEVAVLHELNVYTAEKNQVQVRTFQGTVKQLLACSEPEGCPIALGVSGHFLVAGTNTGHIKMWDIGRREAKMQCTKLLAEDVRETLQVVSVSCNCTGSRISIIGQQDNGVNLLLLWDVEIDVLRVFNPAALHTPSTQSDIDPAMNTPLPELADAALSEQLSLSVELLGRHPVFHRWDQSEPRLLVLVAAALDLGGEVREEKRKERRRAHVIGRERSGKHTQAETVVVSLFVTQESSVLINDVTPVGPTLNSFIGVHIPFFYFTKKVVTPLANHRPSSPPSSISSTAVARVTLRDFVGLEQSDLSTLQAMVEFSYHSTVGNMDEAFKSIKLIKSESVWENMARMCVKTQRLDVAAICLGNMGNARAAKAVREAQSIAEPEARLAVLAVQLGMLDEAEELYKKSRRYDLLNQFYQASGQWSKAMEVAEVHDRMHLKTTHYAYAKHAEALGEYPTAITSYERSETHRFEVPRMLLDDPLELENYVMKSKDRGILKWWAEYLESMGEWEQAMQFYETAKDYYSLVRLLCFNGSVERAVEVVEESGSKAAAYQLARRLSMDDEEVKRAIHFYTKAQCYTPAIQLAKEHGLESELLNLALLSSHEDKREAAKYYEDNPETLDKAIMLYHKAGEVSKALELCFQHRNFDALHQIAEDLGEETSPEMADQVAEYFQQHGQFEKAVELLIQNRRFKEALDLCMANSITITEELAERMTINKTPNESPAQAEQRVHVLEHLAECCANQGSYHLATKKYTQAGNKTMAMKALLKSGDTEKIVFFAGVSRQKDIYVMAANYLQSLDWRRDAEIMKNIISFYTKGRAMESLAGFYDACGQVEIDEYQNYSKALGALNEALKCLGKAKPKNQTAHEAKIKFMKERIDLVQRFADARRLYESDPEECIQQCQSLLDEPNLDTAVRVGDVYGLMIEHYGQGGNYKQAYSLMEEIRQRIPNVNMVYYVDVRTLEAVHSALGIPLGRGIGAEVQRGRVGGEGGGEEESDGEESVGEEVEEGY